MRKSTTPTYISADDELMIKRRREAFQIFSNLQNHTSHYSRTASEKGKPSKCYAVIFITEMKRRMTSIMSRSVSKFARRSTILK